MHSFSFGEYPVTWQYMHNLSGLTTDEQSRAPLKIDHLHKNMLISMKSQKNRETLS